MTLLCVHGHFYQPPREDPISGVIPDEPGAEPFRNWNEKINAECYKPNAELENFRKISFNIGPTLFQWLETNDQETYQKILEQEREVFRIQGVSNALAQPYNHVILPLASSYDKSIQIHWGKIDYIHHFCHTPEGIWLPETAVDTETLEICADEGIKFTILAPWQMEGRSQGETYFSVKLSEERNPFTVFFYDQLISTSVSFNPQETVNGDIFLEKLKIEDGNPRIIASDGELYGHHQPFREKFLAYILGDGAEKRQVEIVFPSLLIKNSNKLKIVKIRDNTSWSCFHGVERWKNECTCTPGANWKKPLRVAINQLGDELNKVYINFSDNKRIDYLRLTKDYIHVILKEEDVQDLLNRFNLDGLSTKGKGSLELLLKAQLERQKMFSSCGWFFDEFHRIEPLNNIAYCAKAVWLTQKASGVDLTEQALDLLSVVKSNKTGLRGDTVFSQTMLRLNQK